METGRPNIAAEDLEHIKDYLTEHSLQLTQSTVLELYETVRSLKTSPAADGWDAKRERAIGVIALALHRRVPHQGASNRGFAHFPRRTEPPVKQQARKQIPRSARNDNWRKCFGNCQRPA